MFGLFKRNKKSIDIKILLRRAKDNDMNAQYELSLAYYRGICVAKDMKKSSYWFDKANETSKLEGK